MHNSKLNLIGILVAIALTGCHSESLNRLMGIDKPDQPAPSQPAPVEALGSASGKLKMIVKLTYTDDTWPISHVVMSGTVKLEPMAWDETVSQQTHFNTANSVRFPRELTFTKLRVGLYRLTATFARDHGYRDTTPQYPKIVCEKMVFLRSSGRIVQFDYMETTQPPYISCTAR